MGRYLEQTESRSELQQRIAAELRAKAAARAKDDENGSASYYDAPDGVEDSAYMQGTKRTTSLSPVWALIVIAMIGVVGLFIYQANR